MRWAGKVSRVGRRELRIWLWWENLKDRDHLEDVGEWYLTEMGWQGVGWTDRVQDRVRWRDLVNPYRTNVENRVSS